MKTYTLILILSLISAVCHAHTMHDGTHAHTLLDFDKGVLEKQAVKRITTTTIYR